MIYGVFKFYFILIINLLIAYAQLGAENSSLVKNYERILGEASDGAEDVSI